MQEGSLQLRWRASKPRERDKGESKLDIHLDEKVEANGEYKQIYIDYYSYLQ
jgi:hypothetical protein